MRKVWEWKQQSGDTIERQMRRLGTSGDWSRSTFTMEAIKPTNPTSEIAAPTQIRISKIRGPSVMERGLTQPPARVNGTYRDPQPPIQLARQAAAR